MEWLSADPEISSCCFVKKEKPNEFCQLNVEQNEETWQMRGRCSQCEVNRTKLNFPTKESLHKYLGFFLKQNPGEVCIKAGHAMYGSAVKTYLDKRTQNTMIGRKIYIHSTLFS